MAKVDREKLQLLVDAHYLTVRKHLAADLLIYNYTAKAMYDNYWTEETMMCRGLIVKSDGTIVARPFKKFFNIEQHTFDGPEDIPAGPLTVTEKMDGSLGILYFVDGEPHIATRGSFISEQAAKGTELLQRYKEFPFDPAYTYLFEIVYPENRIVLNYGDREDLILLAVIETETGRELDIHAQQWPFPVVRQYDGIEDYNTLKTLEEPNKEGFVIRFASGLRLKVKFEEYKRLHRVLTQCTARDIWECLKNGTGLAALLDRVPDEFYTWVKAISKDLSSQYTEIHQRVHAVYKEIIADADIPVPLIVGASITLQEFDVIQRATQRYMAERFNEYPDIRPLLHILYSNKSALAKKKLHEAIWHSLYPEAGRPFREDE